MSDARQLVEEAFEVEEQGFEIAFDRATSSAAGVVIGLCWGELFWRLRLHRPAP